MKLSEKTKKYGIVVLALIGVILITVPYLIKGEEGKADEKSDTVCYTEVLEEKLENLISSAEGVGSADVALTIDGGSTYVYAKNTDKTDSSYSADYVILSGDSGENPVIVGEIYPEVRGVAVVCDGGNNPAVREKVVSLISSALGITTNKITVVG